jgi:hypothetical protein
MAFERGPTRLADGYKIVQNAIGYVFVEDSFVTEFLQVKFKTFQLDTALGGHIAENQGTEVGLAGLGADRSKFGTTNLDFVLSIRKTVVKYF